MRTCSPPETLRRRSTRPASITAADATLRPTSAKRSDVAVLGAGIVGLATAYSALNRGASVTVYERGVPGNGQSGGESRIFRHAHDDPRLVELACRSRAIWREWEAPLGVEMVSPDGVVALGPAVEDRLRVLRQAGGVAARPIDAEELSERLPLLASYTGPARGVGLSPPVSHAAHVRLTFALADGDPPSRLACMPSA